MNLVMKKAGMRDDSTDYTDYTGVLKDVVKPSNVKHQPGLINRGKNAPALRMTVRITRTMREQRNRISTPYTVHRTPYTEIRRACYTEIR